VRFSLRRQGRRFAAAARAAACGRLPLRGFALRAGCRRAASRAGRQSAQRSNHELDALTIGWTAATYDQLAAPQRRGRERRKSSDTERRACHSVPSTLKTRPKSLPTRAVKRQQIRASAPSATLPPFTRERSQVRNLPRPCTGKPHLLGAGPVDVFTPAAPRGGGRRPNAKRAAPKGRPSRVVTILLRNR
jgi:hypothetical protein